MPPIDTSHYEELLGSGMAFDDVLAFAADVAAMRGVPEELTPDVPLKLCSSTMPAASGEVSAPKSPRAIIVVDECMQNDIFGVAV